MELWVQETLLCPAFGFGRASNKLTGSEKKDGFDHGGASWNRRLHNNVEVFSNLSDLNPYTSCMKTTYDPCTTCFTGVLTRCCSTNPPYSKTIWKQYPRDIFSMLYDFPARVPLAHAKAH